MSNEIFVDKSTGARIEKVNMYFGMALKDLSSSSKSKMDYDMEKVLGTRRMVRN